MIVGSDANIICHAFDDAYPEHEKLKDLLLKLSPQNEIVINPTIILEAQQTSFQPEMDFRRICRRLKKGF
jgi:hypothetical protein